jgi:hypothetical protein
MVEDAPPGGGSQQSPPAPLDPDTQAYLERVRRATRRLAARDVASDDGRAALEALADVVVIDVEVPTASARREVRLLKTVIKRLTAWYLRYVGQQITVFGRAVERLGGALMERVEGLEARADQLGSRVEDLAVRVERLEGGASRED